MALIDFHVWKDIFVILSRIFKNVPGISKNVKFDLFIIFYTKGYTICGGSTKISYTNNSSKINNLLGAINVLNFTNVNFGNLDICIPSLSH